MACGHVRIVGCLVAFSSRLFDPRPEQQTSVSLSRLACASKAWDETPLHFAARAGSAEMCALFLQHGADKNAPNADDATPLILAARAGSEAACEASPPIRGCGW